MNLDLAFVQSWKWFCMLLYCFVNQCEECSWKYVVCRHRLLNTCCRIKGTFSSFKAFHCCIFLLESFNTFITMTIRVSLAQGRVNNLEIRICAIKKFLRNFDDWNWSNLKQHYWPPPPPPISNTAESKIFHRVNLALNFFRVGTPYPISLLIRILWLIHDFQQLHHWQPLKLLLEHQENIGKSRKRVGKKSKKVHHVIKTPRGGETTLERCTGTKKSVFSAIIRIFGSHLAKT